MVEKVSNVNTDFTVSILTDTKNFIDHLKSVQLDDPEINTIIKQNAYFLESKTAELAVALKSLNELLEVFSQMENEVYYTFMDKLQYAIKALKERIKYLQLVIYNDRNLLLRFIIEMQKYADKCEEMAKQSGPLVLKNDFPELPSNFSTEEVIEELPPEPELEEHVQRFNNLMALFVTCKRNGSLKQAEIAKIEMKKLPNQQNCQAKFEDVCKEFNIVESYE